MYDWDETRARTDAFWGRTVAALAENGITAPTTLSRPSDLSQPWRDPDLIIGQTCGLPYVTDCCADASPVGRPCYGVEGAEGATYRSALICRRDDAAKLSDFRASHVAINEIGSQSGCNALAGEIQRQKLDPGRGFFAEATFSGSHRSSARLVADRKADLAAIDAVAWSLFQECEPVRAGRLQVIGWTSAMPALPFITGKNHRALRPMLYSALLQASFDAQGPGVPVDVIPAEDEDYDPIRQMAQKIRGFRMAPDLRLT